MKASIDEATARDNDIAQLRAELQEAKEREENLQGSLNDSTTEATFWHDLSTSWYNLYKRRDREKRLLVKETAALHKQLSQTEEKEQEALKRLEDLKEHLRELGKEVEA